MNSIRASLLAFNLFSSFKFRAFWRDSRAQVSRFGTRGDELAMNWPNEATKVFETSQFGANWMTQNNRSYLAVIHEGLLSMDL